MHLGGSLSGWGCSNPEEELMVVRLLKVPEVAVMTGLPESTLRFMRATGYGPRSARVGRRVMYRENDVASRIEEQFAADADRHHGFA